MFSGSVFRILLTALLIGGCVPGAGGISGSTSSSSTSGTESVATVAGPKPTLISVTPSAGSVSGATSVMLSGTGFVPGARVDFGGSPCNFVGVGVSTRLYCTTTSHTQGSVTVIVTNPDGQSAILGAGYFYLPAPTVNIVSPNYGALSGGTTLSIYGSGFLTGAVAKIGGTACASQTIISSVLITCVTPAGSLGAKDVTVTNSSDSQVGTLTAGYTYQSSATVTSVAPTSGPATGGTAVTITGNGFIAGATAAIGGVDCGGLMVVNSTTITCTTGVNTAGTKNVSVTNPSSFAGTLVNGYTYAPAPTVASITRNAGATGGGTAVTITGTGFVGGASVDLGGSMCAGVVVTSATQLTCTTSAHAAAAVNVVVTNVDGQSGTLVGGYTYQDAPTVAMSAANNGAQSGGTNITLTGTGFVLGASVSIGGVACTSVVVVNATTITCTTGARAPGTVDVVVTNSDTQFGTLAAGYTYNAAPTVTLVSPAIGAIAGGTAVTITGTGFVAGATASFGGSNCAGLMVVNATTITCTTTAHAHGATDVVVTNADTQAGTLTNGFAYDYKYWSSAITNTAAPTARLNHSTVWTGSVMIVWGGGNGTVATKYNSGGRYDPATNTWTATSMAGVPTARASHTAIWSGSRMVVWGGIDNTGTLLSTGGIYDPTTDTWTAATAAGGAPTARYFHSAIWDSANSRMVIWGGYDVSSTYVNTGAIFNVAGNMWTAATSTAGSVPSARYGHTAIFDSANSRMIVWGGRDTSLAPLNTGAVLNVATNTWTGATQTTNAPTARYNHTTVWTGSRMVVWGGTGAGDFSTGGIYDPTGNSWTATSSTNAPSARLYHSAAWDGTRVIFWGGFSGGAYLSTGGSLDPTGNTWYATSTTNVPTARSNHSAVWTGTKMIIWGGFTSPTGPLSTGANFIATP